MRWVPLALLLAAVAVLVSSAEAHAVPKKAPWATVNVCDTDGKRNSVGIRAGMPGNGTRQRMYMRFQLQWYRPKERRYVDTGAPSTWVSAGSARFRAAQRGFTFRGIADPPAGARFKLRGEVTFQWRVLRPVRKGSKRKRERVVKRARRFTRGGLRGVVGGKPPGRSEAACLVYGPKTSRR
ncbi:MAG TPA: hypothetical protein VHF88_07385 [Thermoleophilaceae bacterium]|nr:hypothetical protein [Thermoleophilaceae bacterium]